MIFPEVSISRYIFSGFVFAQLPFLGWETEICFQVSFFFFWFKLSKIKVRGIYESKNHLFQGMLVFKNLVVHPWVDREWNNPINAWDW